MHGVPGCVMMYCKCSTRPRGQYKEGQAARVRTQALSGDSSYAVLAGLLASRHMLD
jgi:hypothetical protein